LSHPQIGRLEALLARIQQRAQEPRMIHVSQSTETVAPPSIQTVPPSPDARAAIAHEISAATPIPPAPAPVADAAESHSQLVAARPASEPEVAEEVLELDDRHVVNEEVIEVIEEDAPPPSSRRPKPLEEVAEPDVPHPPPPESGKQIAAQELSFEDDLTGVREARKEPAPAAEDDHEAISLQSVNAPAQPKSRHSMEMEIPMLGAPGAFTPDLTPPVEAPDAPTPPPPAPLSPLPVVVAPPAPPVPAPAASQVQVIRAEARQVDVALVTGNVPASFEPKSFGELLDATLAL
jgi:hypothetical protein